MMKKMNMMWMVMGLAVLLAGNVFAAALTEARATPERDGARVSLGVASNTVIYAGSMVAISTNGYAVAASDAAGEKVVGRAEKTVDNSGTAGDAALSIVVARGIFAWVNGDTFTIADVGSLAYVEDDQTVQKAASATNDVVVGRIIDVNSDGVWVDSTDR